MSQMSLLVYLRWFPSYLRISEFDKNTMKIDQIERFLPPLGGVPKAIAYFYVNADRRKYRYVFTVNQS